MTVVKTEKGWSVMQDNRVLIDGLSNEEAWRWVDRHQGTPLSPAEMKWANGE